MGAGADGIRLAQHLDKRYRRAFAITVPEHVHAAIHLVLRHIKPYGLDVALVICRSLGKDGGQLAVADELQQYVDLVKLYAYVESDVTKKLNYR